MITVQELLENGTNVNATDEDGYTPLHTAARNGNSESIETESKIVQSIHSLIFQYPGQKEIAELLIEKGANVNAKSKFQTTPIHATARNGNFDIFICFQKKSTNSFFIDSLFLQVTKMLYNF